MPPSQNAVGLYVVTSIAPVNSQHCEVFVLNDIQAKETVFGMSHIDMTKGLMKKVHLQQIVKFSMKKRRNYPK
jgi:hypothetical protein